MLTNCIAGLYYGKEDPFDYYKDTNENDGKELKKELSDSIYALIMKMFLIIFMTRIKS